MGTYFNITVFLLGFAVVFAVIYDVIAYRGGIYEDTITYNIRKVSSDYPLIVWTFGFLVGLLAGHLYA